MRKIIKIINAITRMKTMEKINTAEKLIDNYFELKLTALQIVHFLEQCQNNDEIINNAHYKHLKELLK